MDSPNGSGPSPERLAEHLERARSTREHIAGELRELLETEEELHDELAEQVADSRKRRDGYRRALEQLTGESKKPAPKKSQAGRWTISDKKVAQVWEQVRRLDGTFTAASVAQDQPGLSPESARRALSLLRERELVRVTGTGRGGGTLLAVMPGAGEQELSDGS
jgi:uncharacterized membrane protein YccC